MWYGVGGDFFCLDFRFFFFFSSFRLFVCLVGIVFLVNG